MYISYEDVNIYFNLYGIEKSSDSIDYENIYQYNDLGAPFAIDFDEAEIFLGNIFQKKTSGKEYLTQIALDTPEACTCQVYINPKGKSMAKKDLQLVRLKAGNTESFNAGYHTLEFAEPIEITGEEFAVVVDIVGTRDNQVYISVEANMPSTICETVEIEDGKCFATSSDGFNSNNWTDLSKLAQNTNNAIPDSDNSIKAFTISEVENTTPDDGKEDGTIQNTKFENATCSINTAKLYFFSNNTEENVELQVEVDDITRTLGYDNYEYYYYLSPNQTEGNIENWIKINEKQTDDGKLIFTINTKDLKNLEEISGAEALYLYVKEVITEGENKSEVISESMLIEGDIANFEVFIDGMKIDMDSIDINGTISLTPIQDKTLANTKLPEAGIGTILLYTVIIAIFGIGIYKYIRYKNLNKYIK